MQIARHVNDEQALSSFFESPRFDGLEIDLQYDDGRWVVTYGRDRSNARPLDGFLEQVEVLCEKRTAKGRLKTLIEVNAARLDDEEADRILDICEHHRQRLEIRFVSFSPDIVNSLFHATMSREEPFLCQLYVQEDDTNGHVQWSKRRNVGLPPEVGFHFRLHAFPPSARPTWEEVQETGRRISTTGWNPLYRGWRDVDLSEVWNLRRR